MQSPRESQESLVQSLKALGLTKYEALVYIALLKVPGAKASEIHEISGVPRASVYPVLDQLTDKGLVTVSQSAPKRFAAIPPDEGIAKMMGRIEREAESARESLDAICRERMNFGQACEELIWNVYGEENIRRRLAEIVSGAQTTVRMIAHPQLLTDELKEVLLKTADRAAVEIITPRWDGMLHKNITLYRKEPFNLPKELDKAKEMLAGGICIVDNRAVMVIIGTGDEDAVALFSESAGFARFFARYYELIAAWAKKKE